jgi:hypothetical protein
MRRRLISATRAIMDPRGGTTGPISDTFLDNMLFECMGSTAGSEPSWFRAVNYCTSGCAVNDGLDDRGDYCRSGLGSTVDEEEMHDVEDEL